MMKSRVDAKMSGGVVLQVVCSTDLTDAQVILLLQDCIDNLKWEELIDVEIKLPGREQL